MRNQGTADMALAVHLQNVAHWPYLTMLTRIALAVALGLFVGMERERRGKEAGIRTFAFASLLGCLCGLLGDAYALVSFGASVILVAFLNWQRLQANQTAELTTSAALLVTGVMGVLCGKGHEFTPVLVALIASALLAWKERMTDFSLGLTEAELRSAILLGILAFVVYPVLPEHALDPWHLIEPRSAWVTVLLIAAVGFANYLLLKRYGARGAAFAGFLGGLVNSTVVVTELAGRAGRAASEAGFSRNSQVEGEGGEDAEPLLDATYRGTVLATTAMLLRNGVLLALLSPAALFRGAALPLFLMLATSALLVLWGHRQKQQRQRQYQDSSEPKSAPLLAEAAPMTTASTAASLRLESPFSLLSALKFGVVFLCLHAMGTLAQRWLGGWGLYGVSVVGGFVSSSSAVASAGTLAAHDGVSPGMAGIGAVLASLASALVNLPLVSRIAHNRRLTSRVARALASILVAGLIGMALQAVATRLIQPNRATAFSSALVPSGKIWK